MPLPQTEIPGRLQSHFAERGIRMTEQRRAILSVMETASKHLDAAQILRKAKRIDASVDRSTVYRTLRLLKRQGLIDELDLMHIHGEGHYYERKLGRDHIHMACLRCGKIMEFVSDVFEKLKQQVEKDCRFRVAGLATGNWRVLRGVPRKQIAGAQLDQIKKRPGLFSQGRLGSPPPELPNHEMDTIGLNILCKRHFGNGVCPELIRNLT